MLAYLKGIVLAKKNNFIILENNNVGYKIFLGNQKLEKIKIGAELSFWLYHHIREENFDLFGFESLEEQELFEQFLSINGIGPKVALTIIDTYSADDLIKFIESEDVNAFQKIAGIGKKTALRIILELKNRLPENINIAGQSDKLNNDLLDALSNLGYHKQVIKEVLSQMPDDIEGLENQIRWFLKNVN